MQKPFGFDAFAPERSFDREFAKSIQDGYSHIVINSYPYICVMRKFKTQVEIDAICKGPSVKEYKSPRRGFIE
jgi:hypothetical protein